MVNLTSGFPERLRELRDRARWSREEMSRELKVGAITLWRLEKGKTSPTLDHMKSMEKAGLDVIYLLTGHSRINIAVINGDEAWGRYVLAVSKVLADHDLNPSPATFWRLVRLVHAGIVTVAELKKDVSAALERAGELALKCA